MRKKIAVGFLFIVVLTGLFFWDQQKAQALVFVQMGDEIPSHCIHAIYQAKKYHNKRQIYCVSHQAAIDKLPKNKKKICNWIPKESIPETKQHKFFIKKWTGQNQEFKKGYYFFLIDRYFTFYDLMKAKRLSNAFLVESDVLLFDRLFQIIPAINKKKWQVAFPTSEQNAFPTIVYSANRIAFKPILEKLKNLALKGATDNQVFTALWRESTTNCLGSLSTFGLFDSGEKASFLVPSSPKSRLYPYFKETSDRIVWIRSKGETEFFPFVQSGDEVPKKIFSLHVQNKELQWIRERYAQQ